MNVGKYKRVTIAAIPTRKKLSTELGSDVKAGKTRKQNWSADAYIRSFKF